jgi:DNA-binding NtrC family response regulator
MVKKGEFRDDLFYRLNVIRIQLPSLRERADDVPILLNHFLEEFAEENGLTTPIPSDQALSILRSYSWPGNVRELRNFCENVVVLKRGSEITEYDLDPRFSSMTALPERIFRWRKMKNASSATPWFGREAIVRRPLN